MSTLEELLERCYEYDRSFDDIYCLNLDDIDDVDALVGQITYYGLNGFNYVRVATLENIHYVDYMNDIDSIRDEIMDKSRELGFIE